jgi:cytochrome c peroxidase
MMKNVWICLSITTCLSLNVAEGFATSNGFSLRKNIQQNRSYRQLSKNKIFQYYNYTPRPLNPLAKLGKNIFEDLNLSTNKNQACSSCHHASANFADPDNTLAPDARPVSQGSVTTLFGGRNAPTATYAAFSPRLHWDTADGLFIGGVFWDGRASGQASTATVEGPELGRTDPTEVPLADQAKGPFLNPVEMGLATLEDVVDVVLNSKYKNQFLQMFGKEIYENSVLNVPLAYNKIAQAIAAFEASRELNTFSSRFDKFVREQHGDVSQFGVKIVGDFREYVGPPPNFKSKYLTYDEADGLALFNADSETQLNGSGSKVGGMCYLCHPTTRHDPDYGDSSTQVANPQTSDGTYHPLLTDFSYDNLGIPVNPRIAVLSGPQATDNGLGADERAAELDALHSGANAADEVGKFKVSTLRNISETAPYGHNGFFPTLYSIVHFYNTRDNVWPGESFPAPEVAATVNQSELGNLGLNFEQEKKIVLFLKTLTDE